MSSLVSMLAVEIGLREGDVQRIIHNAPVKYKAYTIKKRNGGVRVISQPSRELKALQRAIVKKLIVDLPVHQCATAYREGSSIRDNAKKHAANGPILKFDFADFFPSITAKDWILYCRDRSLFPNDGDLWLSTQILFRRGDGRSGLHLAIGAPSSPAISNALMYRFDSEISEAVARDKVTYTRYADDLTFSALRTGYLTGVERTLRRVLRSIQSPSLKINDAKTILATKKYKRMVTGLILTNDGAVSLGHERKRNIRAAVHHALNGGLNLAKLAKLGGLLSFVQDVEPSFYVSLTEKYGHAALTDIQKIATTTKYNLE